MIQSATISKEGTGDGKSMLSSTQPSSQSTQLLGMHLLDVSEDHLLHYTHLFGYRNLPYGPMLYQPKPASPLTARRINTTFPPALQHELPVSNSLKMPLSSSKNASYGKNKRSYDNPVPSKHKSHPQQHLKLAPSPAWLNTGNINRSHQGDI